MDTIDWQGSRNALKNAMLKSVENALGIVTFTRNALYKNRLNPDPGFLVIYNETEVLFHQLQIDLGVKGSTESGKTANTDNVEFIFSEMKINLDKFDDAVRPVFGKNTVEYKTIWGKNRDRFYQNSYEERLSALKALATAMHAYPALAAVETLVTAYHDEIETGRTTQQGLISSFKTDSVLANITIEKLIAQMDRNLGWLKFFFALKPDPQAEVNAFFDLSKIIIRDDKTYPTVISKAGFEKVCLHGFKDTDMVEITVDGPEDVYICLQPDGKKPCGTGAYKALKGTKVKVLASLVFPDFSIGRQVMATNTSLVQASHIIFTIIEGLN